MSSTREIKQRIKNIESVRQLIHGMHMVASTQLRRSGKQLEGIIPVQKELQRKIDELAVVDETRKFPYYEHRRVRNSLYVVFSADRGLSGSYNNRVLNFALEEMKGKNEKVFVIGSYGYRFFQKNKKNIVQSVIGLPDSRIYYGSENIAKALLDLFLKRKCDEVFLVYTEFENILLSRPKIERILPLETRRPEPVAGTFEPSLDVYLKHLIPFYLHMTIFRAFSEAHISEQASRMLAMDTAGSNAEELVEKLQRNLNRQRQQEVTQELAEIVGQRQ
ncbi:MAG: ATP synthase F1 subunit gamma [Tissierellia bacterium]|jgi:F-type H+-transporting ATPase subunit gamma|nr:ATP synthase F1 subunit gamma [Bacillota bacterium]NLL23125.1 ATP synthase F1 subunit gamma [Tissierellia bacterium]